MTDMPKILGSQKLMAPQPVGTSYSFETVSMDTSFVTLPSGRVERFIVTVNYFTKWVEFQLVQKDIAHNAASMLQYTIIFWNICPEKLLTNNVLYFNREVFQAECSK